MGQPWRNRTSNRCRANCHEPGHNAAASKLHDEPFLRPSDLPRDDARRPPKACSRLRLGQSFQHIQDERRAIRFGQSSHLAVDYRHCVLPVILLCGTQKLLMWE